MITLDQVRFHKFTTSSSHLHSFKFFFSIKLCPTLYLNFVQHFQLKFETLYLVFASLLIRLQIYYLLFSCNHQNHKFGWREKANFYVFLTLFIFHHKFIGVLDHLRPLVSRCDDLFGQDPLFEVLLEYTNQRSPILNVRHDQGDS